MGAPIIKFTTLGRTLVGDADQASMQITIGADAAGAAAAAQAASLPLHGTADVATTLVTSAALPGSPTTTTQSLEIGRASCRERV